MTTIAERTSEARLLARRVRGRLLDRPPSSERDDLDALAQAILLLADTLAPEPPNTKQLGEYVYVCRRGDMPQ